MIHPNKGTSHYSSTSALLFKTGVQQHITNYGNHNSVLNRNCTIIAFPLFAFGLSHSLSGIYTRRGPPTHLRIHSHCPTAFVIMMSHHALYHQPLSTLLAPPSSGGAGHPAIDRSRDHRPPLSWQGACLPSRWEWLVGRGGQSGACAGEKGRGVRHRGRGKCGLEYGGPT